jgi:hypothetical protein
MHIFAIISAATLSFSLSMSSVVLGAGEVKEYEYPELLVSPSASERLNTEAKTENKHRWSAHWAVQASALTTLMAGISSSSDPGKETKDGTDKKTKVAGKMATYIGAFWLGATTVMSATYQPYQSGVADLKSLPQGTKKEKLAYERYAEEALYAPANVACVMKWASFASNLAANALVMSAATQSSTKVMGVIGIFGSILPLSFEHEWISVEHFQKEYKKRIYGPLSSVSVSIVPHDGVMAGMTSLAMDF